MARKTLKSKIQYRINRSKANVFTPKDFLDLSGRSQVGDVLRKLMNDEVLIRFGYGLYAKSKRSSLTGKLIPIKSITELAKEALTEKLNIKVVNEQSYYNSQTKQVPTGRMIAVKGKFSRKMAYDGKSIKFQRVT